MFKYKLKKISFVIYCILYLVSCTKAIDFSQTEDLVLKPINEISLIFFNAPANEFFKGGSEVEEVSDFIESNLFRGKFINDNTDRVDFVFEVENSINRVYRIDIDFINEFDDLVYELSFSTEASTDNSIITTQHIEIFEDEDLVALKQTSKFNFTLTMLPGIAINNNTPGRINLQSKSILYSNIEL